MLNNSSKLSRINEIIQTHGRKGLLLLILFKLLKTNVKKEIERKYGYLYINEGQLNTLCLRMAHQIIKSGRENPTEKDIRKLMRKLSSQIKLTKTA